MNGYANVLNYFTIYKMEQRFKKEEHVCGESQMTCNFIKFMNFMLELRYSKSHPAGQKVTFLLKKTTFGAIVFYFENRTVTLRKIYVYSAVFLIFKSVFHISDNFFLK